MFGRRYDDDDDEGVLPTRTEITLRWTSAGQKRKGPDLWMVARKIERHMRLEGRPESLASRPRRTSEQLHVYRWFWTGDEVEWLRSACSTVLLEWEGLVDMEVVLVGGLPAPPIVEPEPEPEPPPPPREPTEDEIIREADEAIALADLEES